MSIQLDKKSFILYKDSLNILLEMTDEEAGEFIKAIYYYQINGELPQLNSGMKWAINPFINQFIRDDEDWIDKKNKASQAGRASANARQQKQHPSTAVESVEQDATDSTVNVTVTVTANDTANDTVKKQNNASDDADSVSEIFEYWKQVMESPRSKIDDKRTKAIKARLKDYSVEYIKLAIDGCSLTDWNMGRSEKSNGKKYNDIELICRDNTHLDDFAKVAESSKKSNVVFKINKDSTVEFWSYIDQEWQHPIGYTPERALADMDQYGWNLQSDDREVK